MQDKQMIASFRFSAITIVATPDSSKSNWLVFGVYPVGIT